MGLVSLLYLLMRSRSTVLRKDSSHSLQDLLALGFPLELVLVSTMFGMEMLLHRYQFYRVRSPLYLEYTYPQIV